MTREQIADQIVNYFMHKGATVSNRDYEAVIDMIGNEDTEIQ